MTSSRPSIGCPLQPRALLGMQAVMLDPLGLQNPNQAP